MNSSSLDRGGGSAPASLCEGPSPLPPHQSGRHSTPPVFNSREGMMPDLGVISPPLLQVRHPNMCSPGRGQGHTPPGVIHMTSRPPSEGSRGERDREPHRSGSEGPPTQRPGSGGDCGGVGRGGGGVPHPRLAAINRQENKMLSRNLNRTSKMIIN